MKLPLEGLHVIQILSPLPALDVNVNKPRNHQFARRAQRNSMPVLLLADGRPLTDADGNQLKTGQTVTDERSTQRAAATIAMLLGDVR